MVWGSPIPRAEVEQAYSLFCEQFRREPGVLEFAAWFRSHASELDRMSTLERIVSSRQKQATLTFDSQ